MFHLYFSKFTCLIGLNSSGKSTLLHFIDFISVQMKGDIREWLNSRNWEVIELESKVTNQDNIFLSLGFFYNKEPYLWSLQFDINLKRAISEDIKLIVDFEDILNNKTIFKVENSRFMIDKDGDINEGDIIQEYEGSLISKLKDKAF